jgi:hypothetical protein
MSGTSGKSKRPTSEPTGECITSPASAAGDSPSSSPAGPPTDLFGQPLAPAKASRRPGSAKGLTISGTFGRFCPPSSASVALTACLGSRLRASLGTNGSMEYGLTWSRKATPSGLRIWRLRASAHRTSANGCSGWQTPTVGDGTNRQYTYSRGDHDKPFLTLPGQASLAGWPTPMAGSPETEAYHAAGNTDSSRKTVELVAGWATPRSCTAMAAEFTAEAVAKATERFPNLETQAQMVRGIGPSGCPAGTARRGVLNPDFTRWLMGYPAAWGSCGATGIASSRKSRRRSSGPSSKRRPVWHDRRHLP